MTRSGELIPPDSDYPALRALAQKYPLVLASQSPRRQQLLHELGLTFWVHPASLDESFEFSEEPSSLADRLAREKAVVVSAQFPGMIVIGCDTVVALDNRVMDKPPDASAAVETLLALSGRQHVVITALALARNGRVLAADHERTTVHFHPVTRGEIEAYVATGEPLDKAGAYGIQGMGGFLVDSIEGRLDTVVGLPRTLLNSMAEAILAQNR